MGVTREQLNKARLPACLSPASKLSMQAVESCQLSVLLWRCLLDSALTPATCLLDMIAVVPAADAILYSCSAATCLIELTDVHLWCELFQWSSACWSHLRVLQMSSFDLRHLVIALQRQLQVKSQQLQQAQAELQVSSGQLQTSTGMIRCVCSSPLRPSATSRCAALHRQTRPADAY